MAEGAEHDLRWVRRIKDDTAPVRLLREELYAARRMIEFLKNSVDEASDKFWVCHYHVKDDQARECMIDRSKRMHAAGNAAWALLHPDKPEPLGD